ncbi:tRNA lysidine(34) synthetase TilS [Bordetella genomosp. 13]|uniref:tRNA lysidine(34) synthetase TilS n=1 Tax=Bordetella genomosp. 13 TaxID=463040 RepID=UPI00391F7743
MQAPVRAALRGLPQGTQCIAAAVSGGADSAMLALAAAHAARGLGLDLILFHIHHGLQAQADDWAAHVQALGLLLGVPVKQARVRVSDDMGKGIEAAARLARYEALAVLAGQAGASHVLLGHHQDDQAETVLLRLLRGTGLEGMAAMSPLSRRDGLCYLRPWLGVPRAAIREAAAAFVGQRGWQPVEDPTNTDARYTRAAVRTQLKPVLDARWPGWQAIVARHARHMAEAAEVLAEVARADLEGLDFSRRDASFSLAAWRGLSAARQLLVLRHWLAEQGLPMPSDARLAELGRQLRQLHALGHDRNLRVTHAGRVIACVGGRVVVLS